MEEEGLKQEKILHYIETHTGKQIYNIIPTVMLVDPEVVPSGETAASQE